MKPRRYWLFLAVPKGERQYTGNLGYEDEVHRVYRYDSLVSNWRQVSRGDVAVLGSEKQLIGIAHIVDVTAKAGDKILNRCPSCDNNTLKPRSRKLPKYRCYRCRGETDDPREEVRSVTLLEALFGATFVPTPGAVTMAELRASCLRPNSNHSIQEVELARVAGVIRSRFPDAAALLP